MMAEQIRPIGTLLEPSVVESIAERYKLSEAAVKFKVKEPMKREITRERWCFAHLLRGDNMIDIDMNKFFGVFCCVFWGKSFSKKVKGNFTLTKKDRKDLTVLQRLNILFVKKLAR